jgi:hypothetical protein
MLRLFDKRELGGTRRSATHKSVHEVSRQGLRMLGAPTPGFGARAGTGNSRDNPPHEETPYCSTFMTFNIQPPTRVYSSIKVSELGHRINSSKHTASFGDRTSVRLQLPRYVRSAPHEPCSTDHSSRHVRKIASPAVQDPPCICSRPQKIADVHLTHRFPQYNTYPPASGAELRF